MELSDARLYPGRLRPNDLPSVRSKLPQIGMPELTRVRRLPETCLDPCAIPERDHVLAAQNGELRHRLEHHIAEVPRGDRLQVLALGNGAATWRDELIVAMSLLTRARSLARSSWGICSWLISAPTTVDASHTRRC
jgi:hypothetical protein